MKKVLTIAGSDPCGGAGIAADLKTFQALGVYGMSVVTAVTAQNTQTFDGSFEITPAFVAKQIDSVMTDMGADAWKTGMLVSSDIVTIVAAKAKQYGIKRLVVDPVMVSKTGKTLLQQDAVKTLIKKLIPLSLVLTPNIDEAQVLTGIKITSVDGMKKTATVVHKMGAKNVVIKGGHLATRSAILNRMKNLSRMRDLEQVERSFVSTQDDNRNEVVDVLYDGNKFYEFRSPRIQTRNTHGTGCVFASAIAANLTKGKSVKKSVEDAKAYVTKLLEKSRTFRLGKGVGPLIIDSF